MNRCEWMVCERAPRWAPAVRTALNCVELARPLRVTLYEVRSFTELTSRIQNYPSSVAFIEVTSSNLDAALGWLVTTSCETPECRVIAVLDLHTSSVAAALREAGAVEVADSPRRLQNAIQLAILHTASMQTANAIRPGDGQSIAQWARSLLPWQVAH